MASQVTFKGNPMTLAGNPPQQGAKLPDAKLVAQDMSEKRLSDYAGKPLVLITVPSLDTPVCDQETRTFNERATELSDDVSVLCVSRDLPFAQKRWCGNAGVERVETLSDYKDHAFGRDLGLEVQELGLLARSVYVVDRDQKVAYCQLVPEIAEHPDYDAALEAVKQAS